MHNLWAKAQGWRLKAIGARASGICGRRDGRTFTGELHPQSGTCQPILPVRSGWGRDTLCKIQATKKRHVQKAMHNLDMIANTLSLGKNFSKCNTAITGYTNRLHAAFCNRFYCHANEYAQAIRLDNRLERHAAACNCEHKVTVSCGRTHALKSSDKQKHNGRDDVCRSQTHRCGQLWQSNKMSTLANGAKQLVVQEALDTTSILLLSYFFSFTPITNMGASAEGAEMITCTTQRWVRFRCGNT